MDDINEDDLTLSLKRLKIASPFDLVQVGNFRWSNPWKKVVDLLQIRNQLI